MLKYFDDFEKFVEITGFRKICINDAKLFCESLQKNMPSDVEVQLFNADLVATWKHLYFAVLGSFVAFRSKRNLSKSVTLETVLYASAQRQIRKALEQIGVTTETNNIAVLLIGPETDSLRNGIASMVRLLGNPADERVLDLTQSKISKIRKAFDISETELQAISKRGEREEALVDLIIERMALLSTWL
jgi:tRNA threonylcarbamoyladenosine modification (KEOPS) complex Cgi121 subunit